ncbi:hypothetical protein TW84_22080 [Vibrio neptunius]|nr:hypothetical protein TW84_22080 [Vibrio neptunius]
MFVGTLFKKQGLLKYHCFFLEESKRAPESTLILGLFSFLVATMFSQNPLPLTLFVSASPRQNDKAHPEVKE